MTEQTQANLRAGAVAEACCLTIDDIRSARARILESFAAQRRRFWEIGLVRARRRVTEQEREVVGFHRIEEERRLRNLRSLALAAADDGPNLRLTVTADDFALIAKRFEGGKR